MLSIMADQAAAALSNVLLFDDLSRMNYRLIESERRARESSEYLERLLETANDAILTLDERGLITYSNRKAGQWGWTKEELAGREFRLFLEDQAGLADWPHGSPPPADRVLEATLRGAGGQMRTILISTSKASWDGGARERLEAGVLARREKGREGREGRESQGEEEAALAAEASPDKASQPSWMVMIGDVTERRQLERELLHSEKLASIGLLAAGVAHEVGNPLSAISGYAQILGSGVELESERREYLDAILNQTGRIQKILRELLDFSRPSQGLSETLDMGAQVPRIMGMLESQRVFSRIRVTYDMDEKNRPHLVTMDRDHLAQVIIIVAMNAAQALEGQEDPAFSLSLSREGNWIVLRLSDNGPGMSEEIQRRVFDPFFTTKGPGQGTGLGLAICQRIVDSYNGRLELRSAPGQGASFAIGFPAEETGKGAPEE
jgi:signal transduction histidine kinase